MRCYTAVATFPSQSDPDVTYTVSLDAAGNLSCNCRGWTFKGGGGPRRCRHTDAMLTQTPIARIKQAVVDVGRANRTGAVARLIETARATPGGIIGLRKRGIRFDD